MYIQVSYGLCWPDRSLTIAPDAQKHSGSLEMAALEPTRVTRRRSGLVASWAARLFPQSSEQASESHAGEYSPCRRVCRSF
jgi:hypothetical protein